MIMAIFGSPYPHVSVRNIFQTRPPYSYVRFHLVFQHNKMLLKKEQIIKCLNQINSVNNPYTLFLCTFTFHKFQEKNLNLKQW